MILKRHFIYITLNLKDPAQSHFSLCRLTDSTGKHELIGSVGYRESTCNSGDHSSIPGSGRFTGERIGYSLQYSWASLVAQLVKNLPAMREIRVWSLGWEDMLEKGKATQLQYSGLENSMDYIVHGVAESWTWLNNFHFTGYRKKSSFELGL